MASEREQRQLKKMLKSWILLLLNGYIIVGIATNGTFLTLAKYLMNQSDELKFISRRGAECEWHMIDENFEIDENAIISGSLTLLLWKLLSYGSL